MEQKTVQMIMQEIESVIEKSVRPFLNSHGGEVRLVDYSDGTVIISLFGACAGCPSADMGTRQFIEGMLKKEIPEVEQVELERVTDPELLDFARKILRGEA